MQIGLFRYVRRTKSAFVVGGSTIRYRHRLDRGDARKSEPAWWAWMSASSTSNNGRSAWPDVLAGPHSNGCAKKGVVPSVEVMTGIGLGLSRSPNLGGRMERMGRCKTVARGLIRRWQHANARQGAPHRVKEAWQEAVAEVHGCGEADFLALFKRMRCVNTSP